MIEVKQPVIFDVRVDPMENCYPMMPSGAAHNEMILCDAEEETTEVSDEGKMLL
jgi:acetolactate synthase-1/2/3 large subunit